MMIIMRDKIILLIIISAMVCFAGPHRDNNRGISQYNEQKYQEALTSFREAETSEPEQPQLTHNVGLTLYRLNEFEESLQELEKSYEKSEDNQRKADIQYDMGNAAFMNDSLTNAILHYRKSLEIDPENKDAKYNLELARAILKEFSEKQQQQNQSGQQQQQEQQQNQNKDQQEQQQQQKQEQQAQQQEQEEKDEQEQEEQQQRQNPEDMTEEEAEQLLDALEDDEQDLQEEKIKQKGGRSRQSKYNW